MAETSGNASNDPFPDGAADNSTQHHARDYLHHYLDDPWYDPCLPWHDVPRPDPVPRASRPLDKSSFIRRLDKWINDFFCLRTLPTNLEAEQRTLRSEDKRSQLVVTYASGERMVEGILTFDRLGQKHLLSIDDTQGPGPFISVPRLFYVRRWLFTEYEEEMQELKAWWENDEHIAVAKEIQREHFTNPGSLWPNTVIINSDARRQTLDLLAPLCCACEVVEEEIERGVRKRATPGQAGMDLQGNPNLRP